MIFSKFFSALSINSSKGSTRSQVKSFFDGYRREFGRLSQKKVGPIEFLVKQLLADASLSTSERAYILATVKHETADTYRPIREYGKGRGRPYGRSDSVTGHAYYGRGYVQLTWKRNYRRMGHIVGKNLVDRPDDAMIPEVSYKILVEGMRRGIFTGKKLKDYFNGSKKDYRRARRIVNGMDKASLIAKYAVKFENILDDL